MGVDTSIEEEPNMHQPDQFDFSQGHSSKWTFSMEIHGIHLEIHILLLLLQLSSPNLVI